MLDTIAPPALFLEDLRRDVHNGLSRPRKTLPSRWLYDDQGSALFEMITALPEYYPSRVEAKILTVRAGEMSEMLGRRRSMLEYGAGSAVKTQPLLANVLGLEVYLPIDISAGFLAETARRLRRDCPALRIQPLVGDFTQPLDLPADIPGPRLAFFPGSTIGNLDAEEALSLLRRMREHVGPDGAAVIGIDLMKRLDILLAAYDDAQGVTAAFNLNLLTRINRELGADFRLEEFRHEAHWNPVEGAVEMHLVSRTDQAAVVDGARYSFAAGESIHTESSRKYDIESFAQTATQAGFILQRAWTDEAGRFAVCGLRAVE